MGFESVGSAKTVQVVKGRVKDIYSISFFFLFIILQCNKVAARHQELQLICSADPGRHLPYLIHLLWMRDLHTRALEECCFEMKNLSFMYKTVGCSTELSECRTSTASDVLNDSFHFISKALSVPLIFHLADIFLLFLVAVACFEPRPRGCRIFCGWVDEG